MTKSTSGAGKIALSIAVWVVVSIIAAQSLVGVAIADDQWPDKCKDAKTIEPGTYSGSLSPLDRDVFVIDGLEKGDFVTFSINYESDNEKSKLVISPLNQHVIDKSIEIGEVRSNLHDVFRKYDQYESSPYPEYDHQETFSIVGSTSYAKSPTFLDKNVVFDQNELMRHVRSSPGLNTGKSEVKVYSEVNDPICMWLRTEGRNEPGSWSLSFSINDNNPPDIPDSERIDELETELEQKNQRIEELEQQVEKLQSQLDSQTDDEQATINVEVNPAGNQQQFVEGGKARIHASSENADLSEFQIEFGSKSYSVNGQGVVEIPLESAGEHTMRFNYGSVAESVTIPVKANQASSGSPKEPAAAESEPETEDGEIIPVETPGFGVPASLLAILMFILLLGLHARGESR